MAYRFKGTLPGPKAEYVVRLNVMVTEALSQRINTYAEQCNITRSVAVRELLEMSLDERESQD